MYLIYVTIFKKIFCLYLSNQLLNVRPQTIKLLEVNIGNKLSDVVLSNVSLDVSPQAKETKGKNKQMGLQQTKKFLHGKEKYQQAKRQKDKMAAESVEATYLLPLPNQIFS